MAKPEPKKRELNYSDFDEMLADVKSLHQNGYTSHGNWTLGQACSHIANWMTYPMDGFPIPPLPMRMIFWAMKHTFAPRMKRKILAEGFKGGMPTAPESVPSPDRVSDIDGIEQLVEVVERLKTFEGDLYESPLFGTLDLPLHFKVSLLHAQHHFGYLEPK